MRNKNSKRKSLSNEQLKNVSAGAGSSSDVDKKKALDALLPRIPPGPYADLLKGSNS